MKKNWMQLVSLALNVVLLVSVINLRERLEDVERGLNSSLGRVESDVERISDDVRRELEDAVRLAVGYELEPAGIDRETRSLLAEASVTLKTWRADTQAVLLVEQAGELREVPMTQRENGVFTAPVALAAERQGEISLALTVTNDGATSREDLGSWWDVSELLPCQKGGFGGGGYDFRDGQLTLNGSYDFVIYGREGGPVAVSDPVFRVYRNGKLEMEQAAALEEPKDWYYNYTVGEWPETVSCQPGDTVLLTFSCTDDYGLTYEFTHTRWTVLEDGRLEEDWREEDESPVLSWK